MPAQAIPTTMAAPTHPAHIISPSPSSAEEEADELYLRDRRALSPSPEVDLSSPELDDPSPDHPYLPGAPFLPQPDPENHTPFAHRRASIPLEMEERDFKQTASAASAWHEQAHAARHASPADCYMSLDDAPDADILHSVEDPTAPADADHEDFAARQNREAALSLFGSADPFLRDPPPSMLAMSSPLLPPSDLSAQRHASAHHLPPGGLSATSKFSPSTSTNQPPPFSHLSAWPSHPSASSSSSSSSSPHQKPLASSHLISPTAHAQAIPPSFLWDHLLDPPECVALDELDVLFERY